jgi:hypothetical protein
VLGWLVLGAFVWQDCFPVPWPWEFESVSAEGSLVGRRGSARDGDTGVWAPEAEVDSMDEVVLDLAGISTEALYTYGQMLWTIIRPWTGMPVSMNIGATNTRANPANRLAKLSLEAHAVGALLSSPEVEATLAEPLRYLPTKDAIDDARGRMQSGWSH